MARAPIAPSSTRELLPLAPHRSSGAPLQPRAPPPSDLSTRASPNTFFLHQPAANSGAPLPQLPLTSTAPPLLKSHSISTSSNSSSSFKLPPTSAQPPAARSPPPPFPSFPQVSLNSSSPVSDLCRAAPLPRSVVHLPLLATAVSSPRPSLFIAKLLPRACTLPRTPLSSFPMFRSFIAELRSLCPPL